MTNGTRSSMARFFAAGLGLLCLCPLVASVQSAARVSRVDFELMTWPEVEHAIEQGKTTALIYNGGTEQRGPQNVNGGHTLMGHATVIAIAETLGNALAMPVLPFSPNDADPRLPGTIGLTPPVFEAINEEVAEQTIKNGFKNVVLMGDHGGGQSVLRDLANTLSRRHAAQGVRVVYCDDVYAKATTGLRLMAIQQVFTEAYPILPRCCTWAGTMAGFAKNNWPTRLVTPYPDRVKHPIRTPGGSITALLAMRAGQQWHSVSACSI
jgi:hypothetical protein